jgi:hypothetical protein
MDLTTKIEAYRYNYEKERSKAIRTIYKPRRYTLGIKFEVAFAQTAAFTEKSF